MSDISPYGVTQNADSEMVTANQLVGERLDHPTVNQAVGASPAMYSTAPYKGPRMCARKDCGNLHGKGSEWCHWHDPSTARPPPPDKATLMCASEGCGNYHKKESVWCRWHEPAAAS